jgi:hypothetical protein
MSNPGGASNSARIARKLIVRASFMTPHLSRDLSKHLLHMKYIFAGDVQKQDDVQG